MVAMIQPFQVPSYLRIARWLDDGALVAIVVALLVGIAVYAGAWTDSQRQDQMILEVQQQLRQQISHSEADHVRLQRELDDLRAEVAALKAQAQ